MLVLKVILVLTLLAVVNAKYKFFVVQEKATFENAQNYCKSKGYYLLTVKGGMKNQQAYAEMKRQGWDKMWLGVSRRHLNTDEKPWVWLYEGIHDLPVTKTFWDKNQPDNFQSKSERCLEMTRHTHSDEVHNWNDRNCNVLNKYICETY